MNRILMSIIAFFAIISTAFAQSTNYNSVATAYIQTTRHIQCHMQVHVMISTKMFPWRVE